MYKKIDIMINYEKRKYIHIYSTKQINEGAKH